MIQNSYFSSFFPKYMEHNMRNIFKNTGRNVYILSDVDIIEL